MGILDRLFHRNAGEKPLSLSHSAVDAFIELLDGLHSEVNWAEGYVRNCGRLKATFARHEPVLREAAKAIRRCVKRARALFNSYDVMAREFEQPLVLDHDTQGRELSEHAIYLLWRELSLLDDLSGSIFNLRKNWRGDSGWKAHFLVIGGANGPTYVDSTRERLKLLLGTPTPCHKCGAPMLPRREPHGAHELTRISAAGHLKRGLCRNCDELRGATLRSTEEKMRREAKTVIDEARRIGRVAPRTSEQEHEYRRLLTDHQIELANARSTVGRQSALTRLLEIEKRLCELGWEGEAWADHP